ncbi:hypothetical protein BpHYR1_030205 [Brachionus plicatilis]|uniref:Uncharacterized protein n=1 Tax=Brachionus plicatilis TaxID=10195 RepID=A0A3M7RMQ3_BRAPC|nr:hypothetical protein BpHYR1_030205 [Brachionus plicatilis]
MKNSHLLLEFDEEYKIYYDNKFEIFSKAASRFVKDEPSQYEYVEYKCLHWRKPEDIFKGIYPLVFSSTNSAFDVFLVRKQTKVLGHR